MNPKWASSLIEQCERHNTPIFFKQWGEWVGGTLDTRKGKVICDDGHIFWTNPGHPEIKQHEVVDDERPYMRLVSAKVGKSEKKLPMMSGVVEYSNNEMIGGREIKQFPHYYTAKYPDSITKV
jgi:hypothetical protein